MISTPNPYVPGGGSGYGAETAFVDPFIAFGAMGARTSTLRFMVNVLVLPLRNLFVVAKSITSTAVLTGDRLQVGVGVGWLREEFDAVGAGFTDRGERTDEMLRLLPSLLRGESVSASSAHHRFDEVTMAPAATQPVPLIVGGASPPALRRAANADGWVGVNYAEEALMPILDQLHTARAIAGNDAARRVEGSRFQIIVSRPPDFNRTMARRYAAAGVTTIVNRPTIFSVGPDAPLDQHRAANEEFVALLS